VAAPGAVLADQRAVAVDLEARFGERRIVFLDHGELLFLLRREHPLPFVYWNPAVWSRYREPGEDMEATRLRLVAAADPELIVFNRRPRNRSVVGDRRWIPFASDNGLYRIFAARW
jgi:hypothetical protein